MWLHFRVWNLQSCSKQRCCINFKFRRLKRGQLRARHKLNFCRRQCAVKAYILAWWLVSDPGGWYAGTERNDVEVTTELVHLYWSVPIALGDLTLQDMEDCYRKMWRFRTPSDPQVVPGERLPRWVSQCLFIFLPMAEISGNSFLLSLKLSYSQPHGPVLSSLQGLLHTHCRSHCTTCPWVGWLSGRWETCLFDRCIWHAYSDMPSVHQCLWNDLLPLPQLASASAQEAEVGSSNTSSFLILSEES